MKIRFAWVGAAVVALLLAGCGPFGDESEPVAPATESAVVAPIPTERVPTRGAPAAGPGTPSGGASAPLAANPAPLSAVEVVERVWPAVVTVVNERTLSGFGAQGVQEAGKGTGFIVDGNGHIVTNQHVVSGGDRFEVIFYDGEKRPAELVGSDPRSDLAVVRVDGELPAVVSFGDSESLQVGQPVLAIGSPLGEFTGTVTDGIISALNRDFPGTRGEASYSNLIQHNAAINPGNSGGPLFDLAGQVIGVNTLGIPVSPDGLPAQGLFFAIPANTVSMIVTELIETGRVVYPYFGATPQEISPDLASQYDLPVDYGAFLVEVGRNTPAERAGIRAGDIVTAIGDQEINAQQTFSEALYQFKPGDTVPVTLIRDDRQIEVEITLAERPAS